jgi:hypothetical protein
MEWLNHPASPLQWYNCVFAAMIFLSGLYFTISILGAASDDGDADHAEGADGEPDHGDLHDGDAHYEAGHAGDIHGVGLHHGDFHHDALHGGAPDHGDGHDAHHGHGDSDHHEGAGHSLIPSLTDILNTEKRCPLSLALSLLLMTWGVAGYVFNVFARETVSGLVGESLSFVLGLVGAGAVSLFAVRRISGVIAGHMPTGRVSDSEADLVGRRATPSTLLGPDKLGFIEIESPTGEIKKQALLKLYEGPPLRRGVELVVFGYEDGIYLVAPVERLESKPNRSD